MKWVLEEEILLVDLYYQIADLLIEEREIRIKNLSSLLRKRAIMLGVNIDQTFRNVTGIKMKLQNIVFIDTEGRLGLSSCSKLDKEIVTMFKTNKIEFDKILIEVRNKYMNNKDTFLKWLENIEKNKMSENIVKMLCEIDEYVLKTKKAVNSLWEIDEIKEGNQFINRINSDKSFRIKNRLQYNQYISALNCYFKFLKRHNMIDIQMHDENKHETDNIPIQVKSEYEKVLFEKFPRGFKMGASIEVKRFRMFYEDLIGKKLLDDDETIQKTIAEIGIEYEDSRIMSSQNAIDKGTLSTIFDYIDDSFNSGKVMIYYKSIYEQFQQELITTNVYNEKILKQVLRYFSKEKYYFKRSFITINQNTEANPAMEIKELLVSNIVPMSYEEIESEIPHIPLTKLKGVMAQNPEFISIKRNYYTHIDCIYLDEVDIEIINAIIDEAISKTGFITREDVIRELKLNNSHIIEKNSTLTNIGLGNAIAYYCSDNYDCNGMLFSPKGTNLSVRKIFSNYYLNKDRVDLSELEALAKELGFTTLQSSYLADLFIKFARINKETFIRKNNLYFNVEAVDSILDKFCVGDYIAFSQVNTFALFPSNEYSWNCFLLESYVKNYSESYKYLSESISMSKCVGAIVKKESAFSDYNQVLIDVLASVQESCLIDSKAALNYLYENGFIAKRRMSNIDTLITSAKIIRDQRGNE